jgi:hypothetical protein
LEPEFQPHIPKLSPAIEALKVFVAYKVQAMTLNSTSRYDSRLLEDAFLILESWLCLTGTAADYQDTGSGCFISCA